MLVHRDWFLKQSFKGVRVETPSCEVTVLILLIIIEYVNSCSQKLTLVGGIEAWKKNL